MTDSRFIAVTTLLAAVAGPVIGVINTYMSHQREKKNETTRVKVDQLVEQTNGITEKLGKAEYARGLKQGEEHPL